MRRIILFFILSASLSSCTVNKQVNEIKTLGKCEFFIHSIDQISVSGIDVKRIVQSREINLLSMPALALGFLRQDIPLKTDFSIEIVNPTGNRAAINQFDYQLLINDQELVEGTIDQQIEIAARDSSLVPLSFSFNIYKFLANESIRKDIQSFIQASEREEDASALLTIRIKPSILIGNQLVKYPGFINIEKTLNNKVFL